MRTTINVNDAVLRKAKARARRAGITLGEYVENALRRSLKETSPSSARPFQLVTYGSGGLLPGVKLEPSSELYTELDKERL